METVNQFLNRRILLIDDNPSIHEDYGKILSLTDEEDTAMVDVEKALFGDREDFQPKIEFQVESAFQGQEGLTKVEASLVQGNPYAVAFVDMRMPPGWDGLTTIKKIWEVDPRIEVVICSAYSDHSWENITKKLNASNQLLILKKPFDNIEVIQMASALTQKWSLARQAEVRMNQVEKLAEERGQDVILTNQNVIDFMSNISHELLTPMNGVVGATEALRETNLNADQSDLLDILSTSNQNMVSLLHNIIDFNELEAGRIKLENKSFDVAEVLNEVLDTVAVKAAEKHLSLVKDWNRDLPYRVSGDPRRLYQALLELTDNAVKFTESGRVTLGAKLLLQSEQDSTWEFSVADTGIGWPEEVRQKMKLSISQGDGSTTRRHGGLGLGVTLARLIVDKLGGTLQIHSEAGKGTTITFSALFLSPSTSASNSDPSPKHQASLG